MFSRALLPLFLHLYYVRCLLLVTSFHLALRWTSGSDFDNADVRVGLLEVVRLQGHLQAAEDLLVPAAQSRCRFSLNRSISI